LDKSRANYISVIGHCLVEPVVTLLDRLYAEPHPGTTEVQTGARENGYSLSACLLLVVLLESFVARARSITISTDCGEGRRPLDFLRSAYPDCPLLPDIEELFVLRDVIAHNHIWHVEFSTDRGNWMKLLQREIDANSGDGKFKRIVDAENAVTKRLKLKIVPTMIDRYDAAGVLSTTLAALTFIDDREKGQLGIQGLRGDFDGAESLDLREVERRIKVCSAATGFPGGGRTRRACRSRTRRSPHPPGARGRGIRGSRERSR
jgi:hypothetical protein